MFRWQLRRGEWQRADEPEKVVLVCCLQLRPLLRGTDTRLAFDAFEFQSQSLRDAAPPHVPVLPPSRQVFAPGCPQDTVFEDTKHLVQSAVDGYNVCIFAYGQVRWWGTEGRKARLLRP